jgi:precorrin isomerase
MSGARFGSVNTIRLEIGLDSDPTEVAHPYRRLNHAGADTAASTCIGFSNATVSSLVRRYG